MWDGEEILNLPSLLLLAVDGKYLRAASVGLKAFWGGGLDGGVPSLQLQNPIPHVSLEPIEFPRYSSGSVKAQALQEVDKMPGKGSLKLV